MSVESFLRIEMKNDSSMVRARSHVTVSKPNNILSQVIGNTGDSRLYVTLSFEEMSLCV